MAVVGDDDPVWKATDCTRQLTIKAVARIAVALVRNVDAVRPPKTEEEAIRIGNDTPFGLSAYFYSRDIGRIWRVAEGLVGEIRWTSRRSVFFAGYICNETDVSRSWPHR